MFDPSAPHMIILLAVVLLLFGSSRLPGAAQALGKSLHIFKAETKKMHDDDNQAADPVMPETGTLQAPASASAISAPADDSSEQLASLRRQVSDLQRQSASASATSAGPVLVRASAPGDAHDPAS